MRNYNVFKKFKRVAKIWVEHDKKPHDFGVGQIVYHAEIFLLMYIEKYKGSSVTELAKILDMTKASVSEALKKLDRKGFIIKVKSPENASRMMVYVSDKGKEILNMHNRIHESIGANFKKYYNDLDKEKLEVLEDFFLRLEKFLIEVKNKNI